MAAVRATICSILGGCGSRAAGGRVHLTAGIVVLGLACRVAGAPAPVGPQPVAGWPRILGNAVFGEAATGDVDQDGRDEVAVGLRDGQVFLLDGDGRVRPGWPRLAANSFYLATVMADLDRDGRPEILAASRDGCVHAWTVDGRAVAGWPVDLGAEPVSRPLVLDADGGPFVAVATVTGAVHLLGRDGRGQAGWPVQADQHYAVLQDLHPLVIADLAGDPRPEIVYLSGRGPRLFAWGLDGAPVAGFPRALDGTGVGLAIGEVDGVLRIAATTTQSLWCLDPQGEAIWRYGLAAENDLFASPPGLFADETGAVLCVAATRGGTVHLLDAAGTLRPGWPVRFGGFIYGLGGGDERFGIPAVPLALDLDRDGRPELLIPSYDQHLYACALDGTPVPGWPLTLDDSIRATPRLAQLDGRGEPELVVTQAGETVFAFHLAGAPDAAATPPPPGHLAARDWSWPSAVVLGLVILLGALLAWCVGGRRPDVASAAAGASRGLAITVGIAVIVLVAVHAIDAVAYRRAGARLERLQPQLAQVVAAERATAVKRTERLAAALDSCLTETAVTSASLLYHLERLADRERLADDAAGLAVLDPAGRLRCAIGLSRTWPPTAATLGDPGTSQLQLLGNLPVFLVTQPLGGPLGGHLLVHAVSLAGDLPFALARESGASVELRLAGKTLAWAGAPPPAAVGAWPWLGMPEPSREFTLPDTPLRVRLDDETHARPWRGWLTLAGVLALPLAAVSLWSRRAPGWTPRGSWWHLALLGAGYLGGWLLLGGGTLLRYPVALGGHLLEIALHLVGLTGVILAIRTLMVAQEGRRFDAALLGSYLVVSLLPLGLVMTVGSALLQRAQREAALDAVARLETRASHLVLGYPGNYPFENELAVKAKDLLGRPPETGWFNFVRESQYFFTYDLPSAYMTIDVRDRAAPERTFTGFSWRAPRSEKFPAARPVWAGDRDLQGLFLDGGRPIVRAARTFRTPQLEARITSHLPLDAPVLADLESRLRLLPLLPRIELQPAWHAGGQPVDAPVGWRLPFVSRLILPARDWRSGDARWVVFVAHAFLPAGSEAIVIVLTALALAMVPLGLSIWGAVTTWRRTVLPAGRLLDGIRRVEAGDLAVCLDDRGTSEIALASRAFDAMVASLQTTIQVEAEHRQAEQISALKSHFLSMVSHDLKTPLASIQGAAENLLAQLPGPITDRQRQYLEMILTSSGALRQMVTDILDLTRIESGNLRLEPEILEVRREVDHVLRTLAPLFEERGLRPEVAEDGGPLHVRADRTRLWQILGNVLANAVRHSPDGGRIRISLAPARTPSGDPAVQTTVADQGPGIPESERRLVFEPYYARARGGAGAPGAGLGLAIVKQLTELQGGAVTLSAAAGGGASLSFTLPSVDGGDAQGSHE